MPTYDYNCEKCDISIEEYRTISTRDDICKCPECNGNMIRLVGSPRIVSGVNMQAKVPQGFKDVLKKIKKAHPLNKIDGELS